jgi:hypothetical protein
MITNIIIPDSFFFKLIPFFELLFISSKFFFKLL